MHERCLLFGLFLLAGAHASAQCPAGQVPTPEGYCCPYGQRFDAATGTCANGYMNASEREGGVFFRAAASVGYGHWVYTETARNGGGPLLGPSFLIGYRFPSGFLVGGSVAFEPILLAFGQHSSGGSWGPTFAPAGYFGVAVGLVQDVFEIDVTFGFGGGGAGGGAGGVGFMLVPSFGWRFANTGHVHVSALIRPTLGLLVDPNTGRFVVYPAIAAGVGFTYD